jgi:oligosaccharyltransferase complex subunit epsilon
VPRSAIAKTTHAGSIQSWDKIVNNVLTHYLDTTPQRTKLLDAFMAFLVAVGALQFLYCILAGNYVRSLLLLDDTLLEIEKKKEREHGVAD